MFDPKLHYYDSNGFARHKETNHLIGIEPEPPKRRPDSGAEFPKWVEPHRDHVHGAGELASVPLFPDFHVSRVTGKVMVKVNDAAEEKRALAPPPPNT